MQKTFCLWKFLLALLKFRGSKTKKSRLNMAKNCVHLTEFFVVRLQNSLDIGVLKKSVKLNLSYNIPFNKISMTFLVKSGKKSNNPERII